MPTEKKIIEMNNVNFAYNDEENQILIELFFEVKKNDQILITGESGAGKTTLLHIMGKILSPNSGKVLHNGNISFIFQQNHLLNVLTAKQNIALAKVIKYKASWEIAMKEAADLLKKIELDHRANHLPEELSGGEKQRVSIARALITKPDCILCDEPTGSLDPKRSELVMKSIFALTQEFNTAIVMISHDQNMENLFKTKYRLENGKLINY